MHIYRSVHTKSVEKNLNDFGDREERNIEHMKNIQQKKQVKQEAAEQRNKRSSKNENKI